jgi:DNA-binding transcriptional LysR family regulator
VSANVRVTTNTVVAMRDLLVAGAGFGALPTHMVRTDIRSGRLVQVCPGWFRRRLLEVIAVLGGKRVRVA